MGLRQELPQGEVNSDTNNVFGLTVERYVNGIAGSRQALEIGKNYTITYEKNPSNTNQWTFTIKGVDSTKELQKYSTSGKAWTYEVKEDPEKIPGYTMGSGGTWRKTVSDAGTEMMLTPTPLTNTLYTNTSFTKAWQDEDGTPIAEDYLGFDLTVTFKLQVKPDGSTWQDASNYFTEDECGLGSEVLTSIKDGTAEDTDAPDGAEETTVAGLQITNVRRVALSVEKFWNGEMPAKDAAVQVGLYRTTDPEMVGSAEGEAVTEDAQGTDGANRTAELNAENDWKATFAELPKYDATHALYYYYALELNAEGKPVENDGKITYGESDHRVSYVFEDGVTEITNRQIAALSGTKTWVDGSDEARPDTLELTLRRTTEPDAENPVWETVDLEAENITLTWTDTDTDVWTYTYADLPLNAPNGDAYTYAVAERVPDGWDVYYADTVPVDEAPALDKAEEAGDAESGEDAEAASVPVRDRYLTNVRRGNLTVEKTVDGAYGDHEQAFAFSAVFRLPEDFTGEADGVYGTYTAAGSDEAEPIEFTDGTAEVTFTLRDGERIEFAGLPGGTDYRIAETDAYGHLSTSTGETGEIPAGTTAAAAFVNTREDDPFAGLRVLKTVSGTDGETDRAFHFTVTLADDSVNGTYGDMEFVNGVTQFALRDGEARTATGLPAGIGYTVTEEEANQDGYTTTVTGNTGTLEAGVTAQATFDNARDKKAEPTPSTEPTPTAAPTPTAEPTPTPKPEESDAVQTGDETDLTVPSMLFLMSVSGLTAAVVVRRRRRRARGATRK